MGWVRRRGHGVAQPREPDAARHRPDLEARGDRAGGIGSARRPDGRSITSASDPTRPTTSTAWRVRPSERQSPLPFGFAFENPRAFEPLSAPRRRVYDGRLLARRVFPEHEPADRQDANRRQGGELGTRSAGLREPGRDGSRVLFVRGLPRRPRDGVGEDEVPSRHAEHRDRGAVLLEAADAHRCGAGRVRASTRRRPLP